MKSSFKSIFSFIGVAGLSLSISLPALAQSSPSPNSPTPSPGQGVLDQPSGGQAPGSTMTDEPSNYQTSPETDAPSSQSPRLNQPTAATSVGDMTIGQIVDENPSFELLNSLIGVAGIENPELVMALKESGEYTVFAPTDEAFAALPEGTIRALVQPENRDLLVELLSYHVLPGEVTSSEVSAGELGRGFETSSLPPSGELRPNENVGAVDDSQVIEPTEGSNREEMDMSSPGGSPTAPGNDDSAGLTPPPGDFSPNDNVGAVDESDVNAPNRGTSSARNDSPMISADSSTGSITLSGARVISPDIEASNGIIHAIDRVIVPADLQARIQEAVATTDVDTSAR